MRGAPHKGLAWLMRRMRSRISAATSGLPGRRDFLVQYQVKALRASGRRCRAARSAGRGANTTSSAKAGPTTIGRSVAGAGQAARSCGAQRVGDEGRESQLAVRHGPKTGGEESEKSQPKQSSSWMQPSSHQMMVTSAFSDRSEFSVRTWLQTVPVWKIGSRKLLEGRFPLEKEYSVQSNSRIFALELWRSTAMKTSNESSMQ